MKLNCDNYNKNSNLVKYIYCTYTTFLGFQMRVIRNFILQTINAKNYIFMIVFYFAKKFKIILMSLWIYPP